MSLKKIINSSLAMLTTFTAFSINPAYALDVIPGPGAKKEMAEQAAKEAESKRYSSHDQDLLWLEQVDGKTYFHANITDHEFQSYGVGVGNLIAALWENPDINQMNSEDAKDKMINSNLDGVKFKDYQFQQLQSCLSQQVDRVEVKNADPSKTTSVWSYKTHNLLLFNPVMGENQTPPITAQVICELDGYFVDELNKLGSAKDQITPIDILPNETVPVDIQLQNLQIQTPLLDFKLGKSLEVMVSCTNDSIDSQYSNSTIFSSISQKLAPVSSYVSLRKSLRQQDGSFQNHESISPDLIQDTYNLIKQVSNGDLQLSKYESEQLAIDAYNILGDQKSQYFLSIEDIKSDLQVSSNLRNQSLKLGGIGRKEQLSNRKIAFESQISQMYHEHITNSDGSSISFRAWKKHMFDFGASRNHLNKTIVNYSL